MAYVDLARRITGIAGEHGLDAGIQEARSVAPERYGLSGRSASGR
jgi:hypothetical protein